jgi:hypothetical protein
VVTLAKLRVYAMVLGIFVLGAGAGAAAGYAVAERRLADVLGDERPDVHDARRFEALASELDLSREQQARVHVIFNRHREETRRLTRAMFEGCGDDLQQLRSRIDAEIRSVLDDQQKLRFAEIMDKRGRRFPLGRPGLRRP